MTREKMRKLAGCLVVVSARMVVYSCQFLDLTGKLFQRFCIIC